YKIQGIVSSSEKDQSCKYIQYLWTYEDFLASNLKSINPSQSSIFVDPKFIFFEKLLEKKHQREDQFNINSEMDKILPSQTVQMILSFSEVPIEFLNLLELEIFNKSYSNNTFNTNPTHKQWTEFARWAHFTNSKSYYTKFQNHSNGGSKKPLEHYDIPNAFQRNTTDKLIIADETIKNVISSINLSGYKHVLKPQCFKNTLDKTIVDFYTLSNPVVANNAKVVTFGAFTSSNNEPYTTANMASSHNKNYQQC
ncbi:35569_t:CDS:2, partial [Gigaspora margarita]